MNAVTDEMVAAGADRIYGTRGVEGRAVTMGNAEAAVTARLVLTAALSPAPDACQCCGRTYESDLLVDDATWDRIQPEGKPTGAGLLCPDCILSRTGWACGIAVDGHGDRHSSEVTICGKVHRLDADKPSAVSVGDGLVEALYAAIDDHLGGFISVKSSRALITNRLHSVIRQGLNAAQEGK